MAERDANSSQTTVDVIIPVFNEAEVLVDFHRQLCQVIDTLTHFRFSLYFIDDGSSDDTLQQLYDLASRDERITVLELSRNFGHQAAITAGLDRAQAEYVITMDGDGQHPPHLIPQMLVLAQDGFDIVLTQRTEQQGNISAFKRCSSNVFYRLINRIGNTRIQPDAADFRLLSKPVVRSLCSMREYHRFLRGMVGWMGYRSVILPYDQPERLGGKSKYSLLKMLRLSMDALFSFSLLPLYAVLTLGGLFLLMAMLEVVYVLGLWFFTPEKLVPGWSSLMFMLLFVGGTLMMSLGFIGIYTGYIFQEVKHRPLYLLRSIRKAGSRHPSQLEESEEVNIPAPEK